MCLELVLHTEKIIKINNCFFSWRTSFNEISIGGVRLREKGWNKVCLTLVLMILRFSPKKSWLLLSWTTAGKKHMHSCNHVCIHVKECIQWNTVLKLIRAWMQGCFQKGEMEWHQPPRYTINSSSAHPESKPLDYIYSLKATTPKDYTIPLMYFMYFIKVLSCYAAFCFHSIIMLMRIIYFVVHNTYFKVVVTYYFAD